jgi:hypothetical protein
MPTLFLIGLFSFLMVMMSSIIMEITQSRQQLTQSLAAETEAYFKSIHDLVTFDMIPNNLEIVPRPAAGVPPQEAGEALLNQDAIRRLAPPNLQSDTMRDAWGAPLTVRMIIENSALDTNTVARVAGVLLYSTGPDGVAQTNLLNVSNTLVSYQGVMAQGDDIVMYFNTMEPLRGVYKLINKDLDHIKAAVERDFNERFRAYRDQAVATYQAQLLENPATPAPDFNALATTDPAFPRIADVGNTATRSRLGVDEAFMRLERLLPNGGRMRVTTLASTSLEITFGVQNDTLNPSPWPVLGPRVTAKAEL